MHTYCNPLPMPEFSPPQRGCEGPQSLADPDIVKHEDKWYLFASGAQAWVSDDLVNWQYHQVDFPKPIIGPAIAQHDGWFYLAGNGAAALYRSRHPLGPWEDLGPMHDHLGNRVHWADLFFFRDEDGTFYCYHHSGSGVGADGIFVTVLDPKSNFTRAAGPSRNCIRYNPEHIWERWGDANEFPDIAWIESPCVIKHQGRYHLTYSGCGTEWRRYAIGLYTSTSPVGPWEYDPRSPILIKTHGLLNGTGHHCMTIGPDGNWWWIYHVLFAQTHKFDRRLALDPAVFDAEGRMSVRGPTETPQWVPGAGAIDASPGLLPLTIGKPIIATSHAPGRTPDYAVDDHIRTWWEPAEVSMPQSLTVDLQGSFEIHSTRIIFSMAGATRPTPPGAFGYTVETSSDNALWSVAVEKSGNGTGRNIEYDVFAKPQRGRYVRLTITGVPVHRQLGVLQFTAFGRAYGQ